MILIGQRGARKILERFVTAQSVLQDNELFYSGIYLELLEVPVSGHLDLFSSLTDDRSSLTDIQRLTAYQG
jgi:hypothetical protein